MVYNDSKSMRISASRRNRKQWIWRSHLFAPISDQISEACTNSGDKKSTQKCTHSIEIIRMFKKITKNAIRRASLREGVVLFRWESDSKCKNFPLFIEKEAKFWAFRRLQLFGGFMHRSPKSVRILKNVSRGVPRGTEIIDDLLQLSGAIRAF